MASNNYGSILKATTLIGGSSFLNLFIGLARAKAGAIFIGPEGIGLVNIYFNLIHMIRTGFELGIGGSGLKQMSEAIGRNDQKRVGELMGILRTLFLILGTFAFLFCIVSSNWLSKVTFGTTAHAFDIKLLAINVPLMLMASYFGGILASHRDLAALAKNSLYSVAVGVGFSILMYWRFGMRGIVPAIILTSISSFGVSWWLRRRIRTKIEPVGLRNTWETTKSLVPLGLALFWNDFFQWMLNVYKSGFLARELGLDANGIYAAAWGLSALFVNMILSALGTEFFPRLCSVSADPEKVRSCLNEQIEISLLLSLPGLIATILLAKIVVVIFYSPAFLPAADLLVWFTLSNFLRIITWPIPYALLAQNRGKVYAIYQTVNQLLGLGIFLAIIPIGGLYLAVVAGVPAGLLMNAILYLIAKLYCGYLPGLRFGSILCVSGTACLACVLAVQFLNPLYSYLIGVPIFLLTLYFCSRVLLIRTKTHPKLQQLAASNPAICAAVTLGHKIFRV